LQQFSSSVTSTQLSSPFDNSASSNCCHWWHLQTFFFFPFDFQSHKRASGEQQTIEDRPENQMKFWSRPFSFRFSPSQAASSLVRISFNT
jgi:hypothetical protein